MKRAVLRYISPVRWHIRAGMMDFRESFYDAVTDGQSDFAELVRTMCLGMIKEQIPNKPELWEALKPDYNPGCKRVIISDDYYPALANNKTTLDTRAIRRITATEIEMVDGTHQAHDTLILATGFRAVEFLHPINVTGTRGKGLADIWKNGASALYGMTVPFLSNFGMCYGPNSNLGHNSIILMIEAQSRYLNTLIGAVFDARNRGQRIGIMPTQARTDEFNDELQRLLKKSSFADEKCQSWYKNAEGKITNNWSGTVVEYQELLAKVDWTDFETTTDCNGTTSREEMTGLNASKVVFGSGKHVTRIGRVREETLVSNTALVLGTLSAAAAAAAWIYRADLRKRFRMIR